MLGFGTFFHPVRLFTETFVFRRSLSSGLEKSYDFFKMFFFFFPSGMRCKPSEPSVLVVCGFPPPVAGDRFWSQHAANNTDRAGNPSTRRFDNFQRKPRKHAKCKYNIVYDPFAHYFPSVSSLNTALGRLGQRGAYGSELLLQLRSELRAEPLLALLRGRLDVGQRRPAARWFAQKCMPKVADTACPAVHAGVGDR